MRRAAPLSTALGITALGIAGCANHSHDDLTRSWRLEQQLTAQCRRWDAIAANAAHPDAATVARHDKLLQKAAELETAAVNLQGAARDAAIRKIAQAHVEAAAEYDAAGQRRIADQCWEHLGIAREEHQEMARELMQSAAELQSSASSIRSELPIAPDGLGAALIPVPVQSQPSGVLR